MFTNAKHNSNKAQFKIHNNTEPVYERSTTKNLIAAFSHFSARSQSKSNKISFVDVVLFALLSPKEHRKTAL